MLVELAGNGARYVVKSFPEDRAKIDIGSYYADDSAFRQAAGWAPVTSVPDGLEKTLAWLRPRLEIYS
jgi:UDP-glucose 4-epimerase